MVAAAAARLGHTVLHLDTASYYGGQWASFTWDGLQAWIREQKGEAGDKEETKSEVEEEKEKLELLEGEKLVALNCKGLVQNLVETWHETRKDEDKEEKTDRSSDCGGEDVDHEDLAAVSGPEWSREEIEKQSRRFNIDLVPRLLFSRGEMVELLISSNISRLGSCDHHFILLSIVQVYRVQGCHQGAYLVEREFRAGSELEG